MKVVRIFIDDAEKDSVVTIFASTETGEEITYLVRTMLSSERAQELQLAIGKPFDLASVYEWARKR